MSMSTRGGDHISDRQRWAGRLVTIISIGIMTPPLHTSNQEAVIMGLGPHWIPHLLCLLSN